MGPLPRMRVSRSHPPEATVARLRSPFGERRGRSGGVRLVNLSEPLLAAGFLIGRRRIVAPRITRAHCARAFHDALEGCFDSILQTSVAASLPTRNVGELDSGLHHAVASAWDDAYLSGLITGKQVSPYSPAGETSSANTEP